MHHINLQGKTHTALQNVYYELERARKKFPGNDDLLPALAEELGELSQALLHQKHEPAKGVTDIDICNEAIQVACVALRLATEGDPNWKYNVDKGLGARVIEHMSTEAEDCIAYPNWGQKLFHEFEAALEERPYLLIEVGYNRVVDWMVTIWDASGCSIKDAPKVVSIQEGDRELACGMAYVALKDYMKSKQAA